MFHTCNNGTCMQDLSNCKTWCQCFDGFSGTRCDNQVYSTTNPPELERVPSRNSNDHNNPMGENRSHIGKLFAKAANTDVSLTSSIHFEEYNNLEECSQRCLEGVCTSNKDKIRCIPKECPMGFACKNGRCVYRTDRTFRCVCAEGWVGDFCDSKCSLDCGKHGKCVMNNGVNTCVCDATHTGHRCQKEMPTPITVPKGKSYQFFNNCKEHCKDLCIPLKKSFYCMPKGENCPFMFPCQHYCDISNDKIRCVCEPGWIGDMCNKKCSMDCNNGVCYVERTGKEICVCEFGYKGENCEVKLPN